MAGEFRIGKWLIQPDLNRIRGPDGDLRVEPKAMDVLAYLAAHSGEVLPKDRIIQAVWPDAFVTDDVLTHAISILRKAFADDSQKQVVIETIPRRGYRIVPPVLYEEITEENQLQTRRLTTGSPWKMTGPVRRSIAKGGFWSALVLLAVGGLWYGWKRHSSPQPPTNPRLIAVLPFAFKGAAEFDYLQEGMANLLAINLDGIGEIRTVDPRTLINASRSVGVDIATPAQVAGVADRFGAGLFILGEMVEASGEVRITASLYDTSRAEAAARASVKGEMERILQLVDRLTVRLLGPLGERTGEPLRRAALLTTDSFPALKAYLIGERRHQVGDWQSAEEALQEAVSEDESFSLAWFRLSIILADSGLKSRQTREAAEQASRHSSRLPERERLLLSAWEARLNGAVATAEERYLRYLLRYSDDALAWYQLGDIHYHFGSLLGRTVYQARDAFERAFSLEPDRILGLHHLAFCNARLAKVELEEDALPRAEAAFRRLHAARPAFFTRLPLAILHGDLETVEQLLIQLPDQRAGAAMTAAAFGGALDDEVGERFTQALAKSARSNFVRARALIRLAEYQLAKGQLRNAAAELARLSQLEPAYALEYRSLTTLLPFIPARRDELSTLQSELEAWQPPKTDSPITEPWLDPHATIHPQLRLYLLGLVSAEQENLSAALAYADTLGEMKSPQEAAALTHNLAQGIRARVAWKNHQPEQALGELERMRVGLEFPLMHTSPFMGHQYERILRAEILAELGRYEEAIRWYGPVSIMMSLDLSVRPWQHLKQAELYEKLGAYEKAIKHYERFLELWKGCDPKLRPHVEKVTERLSKLRNEF